MNTSVVNCRGKSDPMVGSGAVNDCRGIMISDSSDNADLLDFCFLCSRQFFHDSMDNYEKFGIVKDEEVLESFFEELGPVDRSLLQCCPTCKALCKTLIRTKEALSSLIDEITNLLLRSRKVSFLLSRSRVVSRLFQSSNSSLPPCETSTSFLQPPLGPISFTSKDVPSTSNNDCFTTHFDFPRLDTSNLSVSDSLDLGLTQSITTSVIKRSPLSLSKPLKKEKNDRNSAEIPSFISICNESMMNSVSDNACDILSDVPVIQRSQQTNVIVPSHVFPSRSSVKQNLLPTLEGVGTNLDKLIFKNNGYNSKESSQDYQRESDILAINNDDILDGGSEEANVTDNVNQEDNALQGEYVLIIPNLIYSQQQVTDFKDSPGVINENSSPDKKASKHKCSVNKCSKSFKTARNLRNHLSAHKQERKFICEICGIRYRHKTGLDAHVALHVGEPKFQCEYQFCRKTFTQKSGLVRHRRIHTKKCEFQCHVCGKQFVHHTSLSAHKLIHDGSKKYACHYCDLAFAQKSHLLRHFKVHTGEKPHRCKLCDRSFTEKYNLQAHMKSHEAKSSDQYKCPQCPKSFTRKFKLKVHMGKIHSITDNLP